MAPRLTSLPTLRVKPSSARWAMCSSTPDVSSGVVPMTTTRAGRREVADDRLEELEQLLEFGDRTDACGVEHQCAVRVVPDPAAG